MVNELSNLMSWTKGPSIKDVGKFSQIFDPYPPTVGSFLVLSVGKLGKFLTPSPYTMPTS